MGDDELILGHRDSEWCGRAPIIEEDIAFANIALDEIGHASLWYSVLAGLIDEEPQTYPDHLVFRRPAQDFRNIQLVELPVGDWAFSILRQYLFDAAELLRLEWLEGSSYTPMAEVAAKIRKEEVYHSRHNSAWVRRLGLGTDESHQRMQTALDTQWAYALQMFSAHASNAPRGQAGLLPDSSRLRAAWEDRVMPFLLDCDLVVPILEPPALDRGMHTPHLAVLVAEMQSVAKSDPQAGW
jgi:ring-1,2-phenylacetyl-CoA epoxidase subunit PaaC